MGSSCPHYCDHSGLIMEMIEIVFCVAALVGGVYIVIDAMIDRGEL